MTKPRTIIIGLDGVPFYLLKNLAQKNIMPNTSKLIKESRFNQMSSSIPEVSSVAWSSIITGCNPAEHGIFGFTDFPPNTYRLSFPNFSSLKKPAFWHKDKKKTHIIINVPSTFPVKELNGVHISGFVSLDLQRSVWPKELIPKLKEFDYRLDVDSQKAHQSMGLFLADLDKTLDARIKTSQYLWEIYDWSIFMLVFTGTDRLMHFLWDSCIDENHKYHSQFLNHFRKIDRHIGEILSKKKPEDKLIMVSDHGFESLDKDVYINFLLKEKGFLTLKSKNRPNFSNIDFPTKAFSLDPARIYINMKGKYPQGSITGDDHNNIRGDLISLFEGLKIEGRKAIRDIYKKEDIYRGPYIESAPDLVLVADRGFNLKSSLSSQSLYSKGIFSGKHTQHDAFLLVNGLTDDKIPKKPDVCDVCSLIEDRG
ncbi:MAG: hypothetical protein GF375_06005 [Candidatus Omnitrophica bacterium]|nr:hypothetical protein [Candidatus Omnitrophota bacterium]MBD3269529.1 hypothetical protein [Candidatus Omnitrophota bacterium]